MAESRRKTGPVNAEEEEARQKRRDNAIRIGFILGGVVIIALMVLLARFLSQG